MKFRLDSLLDLRALLHFVVTHYISEQQAEAGNNVSTNQYLSNQETAIITHLDRYFQQEGAELGDAFKAI